MTIIHINLNINTKSINTIMCDRSLYPEINFWYKDENYEIKYFEQNGQFFRLRFYDNVLITPLRVNGMAFPSKYWYSAYYPENFYSIWRMYHKHVIYEPKYKFLFIGSEVRLSAVESFAMYSQLFDINDDVDKIDIWMTNEIQYDIIDDRYYMKKPKIDCLNQAFNVRFLEKSPKKSYNFIYLDLISELKDMFYWTQQEKDLHITIAYVIKAFRLLKNTGMIAIKMININSNNFDKSKQANWNVLFDILNNMFQEMYVFNMQDGNMEEVIYLFEGKKEYDVCFQDKLDIYEIYRFDKLKKLSTDCDFYKKRSPLLEFDSYAEDDYLCNHLEPEIIDFHPKMIKNVPELEIGNYDKFADNMKRIRCRLRYVKKTMDTKPNYLHSDKHYRYGDHETYTSWEAFSNTYEFQHLLRNNIKKLTGLEIINKGWMKMYEMLSGCLKLPDNVNSLHFCEAPGSFILATNYYLKLNKKSHIWHAHDINKSDYYKLIEQYPDRWIFGDIKESVVIQDIASKMKKINFITADCNIELNYKNINDEEPIMSKIIMAQIIGIFACLSKEGDAIVKIMLPIAEPLTISMIYLVHYFFKHVCIYKCEVSNLHNSEVYLILNNYRGMDDDILRKFYELLDDESVTNKTFIVNNISDEFLEYYQNIASLLVYNQIHAIKFLANEYVNGMECDRNDIFKKIRAWLKENPVLER